MAEPARRRRRFLRGLALLWGLSLVASHLWWWTHPSAPVLGPADQLRELAAVDGEARLEARVPLAFRDLGSRAAHAPTVVLLHGSPGSFQDFDALAARLPADLRVVVPDLPGFGKSRGDLPDYSARAHAIYLGDLLDELQIERAHLVAFSMGGAVAAELAERAPERVASIAMVASIGVVELELFGDQDLNHLVHGAQLTAIEAARLFVPHFGRAEGWMLGRSYARNFYDTDQARVRGCLERYAGPMLILHGERDFLVPVEAAREHARIVPQSELVVLDASHFVLWTRPEQVAERVTEFVRRVESGAAPARAQASPARLAAAQRPFDPASIPPAGGPALLVLFLILVVGTFITEDLTTIAAGLLVAQGRIDFVPAVLACSFGVYVGDLGLFLAGRWLGRPVVERRPLSWFVTPEAIERASGWFQRKGLKAIFLSRLMPGLRLPTYFAAGVLKTRFWTFALYFLIAVLVWTPLLALFAVWLGAPALELFERWGALALVLVLVAILVTERVVIRLFTFRGRRALVGAWLRWTRWEFWPPWLFYPPVVLYVLWLGLKHRSLSLVTAVNPAIPTGGFIGESKSAILDGLRARRDLLAPYRLIRAAAPPAERLELARAFQAELDAPLPIVLKPEVGQRGSGVRVLENQEELEACLAELEVDHILQRYVPGPEYGVFYLRAPGAARGRVFSITEKRRPEVVGDGAQTLEELILRDRRAVAVAPTYLGLHAARLQDVPVPGERVRLVELGTHCRGAVFLDGGHLATPELEAAIEELSRGYEGFWFGRYDLRAESEEAFRAGRGFQVLELNGVTSEATHIYDPKTPLLEAYRVLFEQWRLAFEIAAANRTAGARPASVGEMLRELASYRRVQRSHRN